MKLVMLNNRTILSEKNHNSDTPVLTHHHIYLIVLVLIGVALWATFSVIAQAADLAVPAKLEAVFQMPGYGNQLLRPSRIHVDNKYNEIFVADRGTNRILIFTENGILKYEIYAVDLFGSPVDYTVDTEGKIFIIGTTTDGYGLFSFDFDGVLLRKVLIKDILPDAQKINSISVDEQGNLYLIDKKLLNIIVLDQQFNKLRDFPLTINYESSTEEELVIGDISIFGQSIYVPVSTLGSVQIYHTNGKLIRDFGIKGVMVGQLTFPVSVAVTKEQVICVLDKIRFMTLCFTQDGQFLGEFGGKGFRAGWFYHPSWLAADDKGNVYIGQTFNNLVQKCKIPAFIFQRAEKLSTEKNETTANISNYYSPTNNLHKGNKSLNFGGFKHA